MAKVQVVQRFVDSTSVCRRHSFVSPKVHILDQRERIRLSNWTPNSRHDSRQRKKYLLNLFRYSGAKKFAVIMYSIALVVMSVMIVMETKSYRKRPTETRIEDDMYPIQKIDFPGVAICNINVVSRMEAMNFAETLWMKDEVKKIGNLTLEKVKYLIRYMGTLYEFEHKSRYPGDLLLLHKILQKAFLKDYNVLRIMEILTPKCQTVLMNCYWQGEFRKCEELFVPHWTPEGYCCTFNHVRWTDSFNDGNGANFKINVKRSKISGPEYGLSAILRPDLNDYYYTSMPGRGFKVLLYTASDYPDFPSGGLQAVLLGPGTESFLRIKATSFYSSPEVMMFDKQARKCLFNTELNEIYEGSYSYSQCMILCRVSDIRKTCGCIPFFYPILDGISGVRMCTVNDLKCLEQYKYKWWSFEAIVNEYTDDSNYNIGEENPNAHLHCDCWPSCENIDYTVSTTGSNIHDSSMFWTGCTNENFTHDNIVLSVSFESTGSMRLRQDVMLYWYDLLSDYGGLCSLFLGISIITPIELLYLLYLRFCQRRKSNIISRSQRLTATPIKIEIHDQSIYWSEIIRLKQPI